MRELGLQRLAWFPMLVAGLLAACRPSEPPESPAPAFFTVEPEEAGGLTELRWLAPDADLVAELSTEPVECLAPAVDEADTRAVAIGRAAFRAPGLLGGQAARAGVSCAACHRNGRGNLAFAFPGVSGEPGTADVTSSFFSSHRGDGAFNPVPIPDLAGPRERLKVDRARQSDALERFIRGLIVEEFDGAEPPPAVLDGLAAYVRGLAPEACPAEARIEITAESDLAEARAAAEAGVAASVEGDWATAELMLGAARSALGRINERYPGAENERVRSALTSSSSALARLQVEVRDGRAVSINRVADDTSSLSPEAQLQILEAALAQNEPRSLYAQDVLSRALAD